MQSIEWNAYFVSLNSRESLYLIQLHVELIEKRSLMSTFWDNPAIVEAYPIFCFGNHS